MTALSLLDELTRLGVRLSVNGDRLRYDAPKGALTPDLLAQLKANKAKIISLLQSPASDKTSALERFLAENPSYTPLAALVRKAWRGEFPRVCIRDPDQPEIILRNPNRAIQAAVRMRNMRLLRALAQMHAEGRF